MSEYGDESVKRAGLPLGDSDGEGSYDDEYDTTPNRALPQAMPKRESI